MPPENDPPPLPTPPLDYRRRGDPTPGEPVLPAAAQFMLGVLSFLLTGLLTVASLGLTSRGGVAENAIPIAFNLIVYGSLVWFSVYSWVRWRWRGFVVGYWSAVSLVLLTLTCFCGSPFR